jgi:hypothetical protein
MAASSCPELDRRYGLIEAAGIIPLEALGTTDDCGFSPFADDTSFRQLDLAPFDHPVWPTPW